MKFLRDQFIILFAVLVVMTGEAQAQHLVYLTGYSSMMKLSKDMYGALKPQFKEMISPQPIFMDPDFAPFIRIHFEVDEPKPLRGVFISAGFIDLVNYVAHARAIEKKEKGYFQKYVMTLSLDEGELKPLVNDTNPKYWTQDMMNEQLSNFNSIVGMLVGIKLAHHYLGHFEKYKDKLLPPDGPPAPMYKVVTEKEWEDALKRGSRNALDAGCTIEGVLPFFEAFEKMPKRPSWASDLLPDAYKYAKIRKELERIQNDFFAGKDE